jgi:hypothetical protein
MPALWRRLYASPNAGFFLCAPTPLWVVSLLMMGLLSVKVGISEQVSHMPKFMLCELLTSEHAAQPLMLRSNPVAIMDERRLVAMP